VANAAQTVVRADQQEALSATFGGHAALPRRHGDVDLDELAGPYDRPGALDQRLQRLAASGLPGLRYAGAHYIVLGRA
jgi:hypothetical protein